VKPSTISGLDLILGLIILSGLVGCMGYMLGHANATQADYEARLSEDILEGRVLVLSMDDIMADDAVNSKD
jgi:hypothetical protein